MKMLEALSIKTNSELRLLITRGSFKNTISIVQYIDVITYSSSIYDADDLEQLKNQEEIDVAIYSDLYHFKFKGKIVTRTGRELRLAALSDKEELTYEEQENIRLAYRIEQAKQSITHNRLKDIYYDLFDVKDTASLLIVSLIGGGSYYGKDKDL